ncbi:MAG: electron transfer flavoprotein subunit beta/FixA family protein [Gemmatimonadetes bacterium]|nr:electron transfer flavoprotein subunit beta/FixA family protein [Gemmatimonadota bacterium]
MNVLVCVKRVPDPGARIELAAGDQAIETRKLGFTIGPHEECAVEEAVRLIEKLGGSATVLTLGPADAEEQLRDSMAVGADRGILLETEGDDWDPAQTAAAIVAAIRAAERQGSRFDLFLFGNESADAGGFQVGIRVAQALDLPCITGVKRLEAQANKVLARREIATGWEVYEVGLPALLTVREGLNSPRHPSFRSLMAARKKPIERSRPERDPVGLELLRLRLPPDRGTSAEMLGEGKAAVPRVIEVLKELGVLQA